MKYYQVIFDHSGYKFRGCVVASNLEIATQYANEYYNNVIEIKELKNPFDIFQPKGENHERKTH